MTFQPANYKKRSEATIDADASYALNVFESMSQAIRLAGRRPEGAVVLEVGPGWDFGAQLLLASAGAEVVLADRFLARFDPDYHPKLYAEIARRSAGSNTQLLAAAEGGYAATTLRLLEEPAETLNSITDRSIDVVFSNAVMEHVVDMRKVACELARVTKVRGFGWHQIDWRSHLDFDKPLEHLIMKDEDYAEIATSCAFEIGNRLRSSEFWAIFEAAGFEVQQRSGVMMAEAAYLADAIPRLRAAASPYSAWPAEDLKRIGGCLTMVRQADDHVCRQRGDDALALISAIKQRGRRPAIGMDERQAPPPSRRTPAFKGWFR